MRPQILEAIVGLAGGDEGKGKIVDERAADAQALDNGRVMVVRFQGGCNAGHSIYVRNSDNSVTKFVTHALPTGVATNSDVGIGPQVAFDPLKFAAELTEAQRVFDYTGRIMISERTGVLLRYHKQLDAHREGSALGSVGSTKSGIAPFYEDRARRTTRITFRDYISERFPDKLREVLEQKQAEFNEAGILVPGYIDQLVAEHEPVRRELAPFAERLEYRMQEYLKKGHIIVEGAQGTLLDVDMGTIPDQTSSHLLAQDAFSGLGLPRTPFTITGVEKVYPTRVGNGTLVTLANDAFGEETVTNAGEFGATTGRRRRAGYPDWVYTKFAAMVNNCDYIVITRVDNVQGQNLRACIAYEHPDGSQNTEVPMKLEGVKPIYGPKTYNWKLWDGPSNLADPVAVDPILRDVRAAIVREGINGLPESLNQYCLDHTRFVGTPIRSISIGAVRGETVLLEK